MTALSAEIVKLVRLRLVEDVAQRPGVAQIPVMENEARIGMFGVVECVDSRREPSQGRHRTQREEARREEQALTRGLA